ncbi:MAG: phage terminase large subunit [Gammaproteobacteria bacterium]|nr:phage terminase large subunit [Gammaproteobacteria bacterium]
MTCKKTAKQHEAIALLKSPATHILLYGGSRSGKTLILLYAMVVRAMKVKSRHLILRQRFAHVKRSVWHDTLKEVLDLTRVKAEANHSDHFLTFPNGSEIWIGGLDDKERTEKVLGTEYSTILFNECSQIAYDSIQMALPRLAENSGLVNRAYYDCNPPARKHWIYKLFIEKVDPETGGPVKDPLEYKSLLMNPIDNKENLPADYIEKILSKLAKRKRDRFLLGLWGEDAEGALWKSGWILRAIVPDYLERIVVAVDPAMTHTKRSDETGIVVAGKAGNRLYVLDDLSGKFSPLGWGRTAVLAYRKWNADRIVGEVNNGGDLVESNVRQVDSNVSYKEVHASRGKAIRAEPIAALYEEGRGLHCGEFPELEEQMCGWIPPEPGKRAEYSPDRMDALVWAATELIIASTVPKEYTVIHDAYEEISKY